MGGSHSTQTIGSSVATVASIGFDPEKMKDQDIKVHCATQFGGDPVQTAACIDGIVKMRGQESCKTVEGVTTCTKITSSEFTPGMKEGVKGATQAQPAYEVGMKEGGAGDPIVDECKRMFPGDPTALEPCVASMYDCKKTVTDPSYLKPCFEKSMMKFKNEVGVKGGDVFTESIGAKIGKVASGYCAEGSVCGTPMYGRPLWIWILALLVIILALQGLQGR